jgi:hypothetical protein
MRFRRWLWVWTEMPDLAAYLFDCNTLLGLVEVVGDLLLAKPRLLDRQIPSVAQWPNLRDFSRSERSGFPGSGHMARRQ